MPLPKGMYTVTRGGGGRGRRALPRGVMAARPVRPSAFAKTRLRDAIRRRVKEMYDDYRDEIARFWRQEAEEFETLPEGTPPEEAVAEAMAEDAKPKDLRRMTPAQRARFTSLMAGLGERWEGRFAAQAAAAVPEALKEIARSSRTQFVAAMRDIGLAVRMEVFAGVREEILRQATTRAVDLIKSIPREFHDRVNEAVREGVARGRDLAYIEGELSDGYGITRRRAAMIATDQTNKVNEALSLEDSREMGITQGVWTHHAASKVPRDSHVEMNGMVFNLSEGLYDPEVGRNVMPAELPNCQCSYMNVIPTMEDLMARGVVEPASMRSTRKGAEEDKARQAAEAREAVARRGAEAEEARRKWKERGDAETAARRSARERRGR